MRANIQSYMANYPSLLWKFNSLLSELDNYRILWLRRVAALIMTQSPQAALLLSTSLVAVPPPILRSLQC